MWGRGGDRFAMIRFQIWDPIRYTHTGFENQGIINQWIRKQKNNMQTLFNLKQLHEKYDVSVRTWREYIKRKELRAFKIGRSYLVSEDDVMTFFKDKEAYTWRKKGEYPFDELQWPRFNLIWQHAELWYAYSFCKYEDERYLVFMGDICNLGQPVISWR